MSDNSKFWLSCHAILGATIVLIVAISTSYWKDHNKKIVELIVAGADPVAAMCAMQDDYGKMPVCLILATQKGAIK